MCPNVEHIVECSKSPNFVTNSKALGLLGLNGFLIYRIFKWKQGKLIKIGMFCSEIRKSFKCFLQTVTNLRTLHTVKIATIALGICLGVDSIILGISNEQNGK